MLKLAFFVETLLVYSIELILYSYSHDIQNKYFHHKTQQYLLNPLQQSSLQNRKGAEIKVSRFLDSFSSLFTMYSVRVVSSRSNYNLPKTVQIEVLTNIFSFFLRLYIIFLFLSTNNGTILVYDQILRKLGFQTASEPS